MEPGIYTLVLRLDQVQRITVGSLGIIGFEKGFYSYTGSARGLGGMRRVKRHLQILRGINKTKRWHVDYLLPFTSLQEVFVTPTSQDTECQIARSILELLKPIKGFGCTDCRCVSHLHYSDNLNSIQEAVWQAHKKSTNNRFFSI